MIKANTKKFLYPITAVAAFILLWYLGCLAIGREYILPSPHSAVSAFFSLINGAIFWRAAAATLLRSLISFGAAFIVAVILASFSAVNEAVKRLLSPIITILRSVPTISVILISLIWLKSDTAPGLIAFLIVFPLIYAAVLGALQSVDKRLIQMSEIYGVRKRDVIRRLYIPSILPAVFTASKSSISLNLKIIIASEVLANTVLSIGFKMQYARLNLLTPMLFAWTIAAVLQSFLLEISVDMLRKIVIKWERKL